MTKPNLTAINLIIDSSGSMQSMVTEANQALLDFVVEQSKIDGEALWSIVLFNTRGINRAVWLEPTVDKAPEIQPAAMTPLYDAMGETITALGNAYADMPEDERPDKVLVAVMTDGLENASAEWSGQAVRELVKRQQDEWQWDFLFMATGLDQATAERQSHLVGVVTGQTVSLSPDDHVHGMAGASYYATEYRGGRVRANSGTANATVNKVVKKKKEQK